MIMEKYRLGLTTRIAVLMIGLASLISLSGCSSQSAHTPGGLARKFVDSLFESHNKNAGEVGEISRTRTDTQEDNQTPNTYTNKDEAEDYIKARAKRDLDWTINLYKGFFWGTGRPIIDRRYNEEN
jgi:hypothetical protein